MAANYESQASTNYKEAFSLFDKRGNGRVALDSLGDLLRACGQNPTLTEIRDLEKTVGGDCKFAIPVWRFFAHPPSCRIQHIHPILGVRFGRIANCETHGSNPLSQILEINGFV